MADGRELGTNEVDIYKCSDYRLGEFYLVDTPGFDDTHLSDTDILIKVANWLSRLTQEEIRLTGIIYLHRIFDNRVGGSGMRNLRFFKKLCGDRAMSQVVLATTMWHMTDEDTAKRHEAELMTKPDFWGSMIANGSKVLRQDNDKVSARAIIKYLIDKKASNTGRPRPLAIQEEMQAGKSLEETGAGQEMQSELAKQKAEYERQLNKLRQDLKQAIRENDKNWQAELQQLNEENKAKTAQADADRKKLNATNEALMKQLNAQEANEADAWKKERDNQQRLTARLEYELRCGVESALRWGVRG